jgi:hypothetical protein
LADLGVKNEKLFASVTKAMVKKEHKLNPPEQPEYQTFLKPIDCAMLMTAFCRTKVFDPEMMDLLIRNFKGEINFESAVTMYCAHLAWIHYFKTECE